MTATMPKMKTHSGAAKRFKITGSGKVMRVRANRQHLFEHKSSRVTRRLFGEVEMAKADVKQPQPRGRFNDGTRQAFAERQEEAQGSPRAREGLPRTAVPALPQGQGA